MDKMGLIGLFFIAVLLFSIVGFSIMMGSNGENNDNTEIIEDEPIATSIIYEADVVGTVKELPIGAFKVIGYTNEADITKIDLTIKSLEGVYNVNSGFSLNKDTSLATYLYVADVTGFDINYTSFKSSVAGMTELFKDSIVYPYAKVDFKPKVILFNKDFNSTKEYEFGIPEAIVLVNSNTLQGDKITFHMKALFTGDVYTNSENYEISNETAAPKSFIFLGSGKYVQDFFALTLPIVIDENKFGFVKETGFDFNYINSADKTILQLSNDTDVDALLLTISSSVLMANFNLADSNIEVLRIGHTFLDFVTYLDKNIDYQKDVPVYGDLDTPGLNYNDYKLLSEDMNFRFTATVSRDSVLSVFAEPV